MSNFDIIIKNGTIYDGTGNDSFVSDVFIKNGKIITNEFLQVSNLENIWAIGD